LLRSRGDDLFDSGGQHWFSFVGADCGNRQRANRSTVESGEHESVLSLDAVPADALSPDAMLEMAEELEDQGDLTHAADAYRAALAAGRPTAETCFALAEVLYRLGDLPAARERYFMAIELDENYVEARANLGCLLAEQGQLALAEAAFEGALRYHPDYADAHYHLARLLHQSDRKEQALPHWQAFIKLAPDSPWAIEARLLLALAGSEDQR
jgi:tetratricopeptide (TPR) repeat protein